MPLQITMGDSPIVVALPYSGTNISKTILRRLNEEGRTLGGTNVLLNRVVSGLRIGASSVAADFHYYVSDPEVEDPAYTFGSKKSHEGCVPLYSRQGKLIWDKPPDNSEATIWRSLFFTPYHAALRAQVARVRALHGHTIVLTVRSAPSGTLQKRSDVDLAVKQFDPNLVTLANVLRDSLANDSGLACCMREADDLGWSTQNQGGKGTQVHAFQLSIDERLYLAPDKDLPRYDVQAADKLIRSLRLALLEISQTLTVSDGLLRRQRR